MFDIKPQQEAINILPIFCIIYDSLSFPLAIELNFYFIRPLCITATFIVPNLSCYLRNKVNTNRCFLKTTHKTEANALKIKCISCF